MKGKEPSNEKPQMEEATDEPFEGIERVLAAVGFPSAASPARRGVLSKDLFAAPVGSSSGEHPPMIEPLHFQQTQPGPSSSMFTGLETPKMAKRNSKDKIPGSSTGIAPGAPLMSLPYPFSRPGAGQVSSKDLVPFPGSSKEKVKGGSKSGGSGKSSKSKSTNQTSSEGSGSGSGSGSAEEDEEEEGQEEDEDEIDEDDDEDDEDEEEDDFEGSEGPSSGQGSGSMSSLGQPIGSPARYPFGMRRPAGVGHSRNFSGVSSGMSSGGHGLSGGSHVHSHSMSSSHGTRSAAGVSVFTQSTGNRESTDSEFGPEGRPRASLSQGSSVAPGIPMPPRHPHPQGQARGRSGPSPSSSSSSAAAAAALASLNIYSQPVVFPSVQPRRRADSGPVQGHAVDPELLYGEGIGSDIEGQHELRDDEFADNDHDDEELDEEENGEREDRLGLLVPSPRPSLIGGSRVSLTNSSSSSGHGETRSRTHSSFSVHSSRSRHSSTRAQSRPRTHSSHAPSVRERANSLGTSVRSMMQGAAASLTQLDSIMRGATGPAAGLGLAGGSRPRSRVNSSMARLEEDVAFTPSATGDRNRGASGTSSGSSRSGDVALNPLVGRTRRAIEAEAEGYSSSGGTHSRSGSESMSTENYTFGRPVLFMRPGPGQQQQDRVVEEDQDEILVERSAGNSARSSGRNSRRVSPHRSTGVPIVMRAEEQPGQDQAQSFTTASFYSGQPSVRTISPTAPLPGRGRQQDSLENTPEHSPERVGVDIPWNNQQFLAPPTQRWPGNTRQQPPDVTSIDSSPPDISTAAGSFVTAPATIEGNTTATDSSGQRTVSSTPAGYGIRVGGTGGMVERPGEDMGAGGSAWRVV